MRPINEVGNVYGKWKVIAPVALKYKGQLQWLCKCECGVEKVVLGGPLRAGKSKSCQDCATYGRARTPKPSLEALLENTDKIPGDDGCWNWKGSLSSRGYGRVFFKDPNIKQIGHIVTRIVLSYKEGRQLDPKECACHKCDNPKCIRPEHLFVGTNNENLKDRDAKGRQAKGSRAGLAKLNEEQAFEIKNVRKPIKFYMEKFGIGRTAVQCIRAGTTWKHVPFLEKKVDS